ncbi:MAG: hypothetical protein KF732_03575 [Flavobacteriales bacterium]|nr:hypothetical protein [Flavobacteriales bacterium]
MKKSFKILALLMLSTTALFSQTVNMLSDTGNVGVGTTSPSTKLEVIGDTKLDGRLEIINEVSIKDSLKVDKKLTVEQDVKIKGQSVFDGEGKFKTDLRVLGTARMKEKLVVDSAANFNDRIVVDGIGRFNDEIRVFGTARMKEKLVVDSVARFHDNIVVDGLGRFNGNLRLMGDFIFGDNKRIGYLPASGGNPEVIGFGRIPSILPPVETCGSPSVPTVNQFSYMVQTFGYTNHNETTGKLNVLEMGYDGANGIIEMRGKKDDGTDPALLINWYCGKNVAINTNPAKAGNVTMTSATMGMVGIGKTPNYKLDVAGDVSINSNKLFFKDENHGLGYFQDYADQTIDGPVLFGYLGGALATKQGTVTKNILTWNVSGEVSIKTDATQNTKTYTVVDGVSGYDVYRVMSNGHVFATELTIKLKEQFDFPDYVFAKDYQLMPLAELDHFITKNKHLPNIPNAKEVEKNGLNVSEIQVKQMEKIEELTLYILELNKRLEKLEKENASLKEQK